MIRSYTRRLAARASAVALTAGLLGSPALATNGYFSNGYSPESKGLAGAGVAVATDTLGMAQNPAVGVTVGHAATACLTAFAPSRSFTVSPGGPLTAGTQRSRNEFFLIPCGGANFALSDRATLGIIAYGNGGMNTEYATNPFAGLGAGSSPLGVNLEQLFLQANYARSVSDTFSFGIGPVLAIQRFSATGLEAFSGFSMAPGLVTNNGDSWSRGVGLNIGVLVKPTESLTFGASYRSKINMSPFDGYAGLFAEGGDFDIPATATVGVAFKPQSDARLTLTAEYQRIFYSGVAAISNSGAMLGTPLGAPNGPGFGWKDMDVVRIGASYQANDRLTLRGGLSHNSGFIDDQEALLNILAPATPTWHASVGASYRLNDRATLTAAYTHVFGPAKSGANLTPGLGQPVSLKMRQSDVSVGVSWKF